MCCQRLFHFQRAHQMPGGVDDIVGTSGKTKQTAFIRFSQVPGVIKTVFNLLACGFRHPVIFREHGRESGPQIKSAVFFKVHDRIVHRTSHPSGSERLSGLVGDADGSAFRLEPGIIERTVKGLHSPFVYLFRERFSDAVNLFQGREIKALKKGLFFAHQPAQGGGCGVPKGDLLVLQDRHPAFGVKTAVILQRRNAAQHRSENAVNRAGDPGRVGGAPVYIIGSGMQDVLHTAENGSRNAVPVENGFGHAGGSGCKNDEGGVIRSYFRSFFKGLPFICFP